MRLCACYPRVGPDGDEALGRRPFSRRRPVSRSDPTVVVIIPLYNKALYVARALDSVLSQSFDDFEVIVVNDGSSDGGPNVVAQYGDPRVRMLTQANRGPGAARNRGIRESASRYLAFLDADDEWLPTFLEHSLANLAADPDCALSVASCYTGPNRVDRTDAFLELGVTGGPFTMPYDMAPHRFKGAVDYMDSGVIVCERRVVEDLGGFYDEPHTTYGEDAWIWMLVLLNHRSYRDLTPLAWKHTEASELGEGRRTVRPAWPFLTDPEPFWVRCPEEYHPLLAEVSAHYALVAARRHAQFGDVTTARRLLRDYPLARRDRRRYWGVQWRILRAIARSWIPGGAATLAGSGVERKLGP